MPVTFWWDLLRPTKPNLGIGKIGSVQLFVVMPGGRRVIFEPSVEVYFSTCKRWNDSVPIHRLPTELLSHIFLLAITPRGLECDPSGHPLSRVCSLWRTLILDTPVFWATISNLSSRHTVELKLQLSRSCNLDFVYSESANFRGPFLQGIQFMRLIGRSILRCNSLRIRVSSGGPSYVWICASSWRSHIPRLVMESANNSLKRVPKDSIPQEVQNVCLKNIGVPWSSGSFPNLVSLQVTGSIVEPLIHIWEGSSAFKVVTDILRACPCLKALKLGPFQHEYSNYADDSLIQGDFISFPSLENLEMEGSSSELFWRVLGGIEFPGLSKLNIYPTQLNPYSRRMMDSVLRDIGGRSLLQSVIDRANCERLTVRIKRGPSAGITVQATNNDGKVIDLDPLTRDFSEKTVIDVIKAIKSSVHIEIAGETDGSFLRYVKENSMIASLPYSLYSQED